MESVIPPLLRIYARNIELLAVKRGIPSHALARKLGLTANTLNRIRFARSRYLDPEVFVALLGLFECEPNDLLLPQPGIDYSHDIRTR